MSAPGRAPKGHPRWYWQPSRLALCLSLLGSAASAAPPAGVAAAEPLSVCEMTVVWTRGKADQGLPRDNLSLPAVLPTATANRNDRQV
jgi:hypothetical protein